MFGIKGSPRRVESFEDEESLGDHEDASKQGRSIAYIDVDVEVTLVDETQVRQDDELMFDTGVLDTDEMPVKAKVDEKDEQSTKLDDSTVGEAIKAAKPKVVTTVATTTTTTRPKAKGVVVQEPCEFRVPQEAQPLISKDKGKEEQKLERKQEEEANIALIESWENTQAMMEADRLLAERLQSKEREELTDEEKGKLIMELIKKKRKHFAALRAQEKRNKPPTKAQKRTQMSTYLKHIGKEQQQESSKKQRMEEEKESDEVDEVSEDDEDEIKKHLVIKKDEDIAMKLMKLVKMIKTIKGGDVMEFFTRIHGDHLEVD
ncbi:hypothetical protein Tco_0637956 [Tanacetum coccineum]